MKTFILREKQDKTCSVQPLKKQLFISYTAYEGLPQVNHLHCLKLKSMNIPTNTVYWLAVIHHIATPSQDNVKNHI